MLNPLNPGYGPNNRLFDGLILREVGPLGMNQLTVVELAIISMSGLKEEVRSFQLNQNYSHFFTAVILRPLHNHWKRIDNCFKRLKKGRCLQAILPPSAQKSVIPATLPAVLPAPSPCSSPKTGLSATL